MRHTLKIISISLLTFGISSCDFLDVPLESSVATSNFYTTIEDFDMSLTGVYNILLSANWDDDARYGTYFSGFMVLGRVGTDEMYARYGTNGETELSQYTYTASNKFLSRTWYMMYKGIQCANVIINRLEPLDLELSEKNRIMGESYFLRSFFYFHLARLFGGVPIVTEEVSDPSTVDPTVRSLEDVYGQIVSDLQNAVKMLPENTTGGRASKYAAKAMLGKVYLQMAGEPLKDAEAAALAETELGDVINSGRYALVDDFFSQFDGKHEHGSEYIWDIEFCNDGTTTYGGQVGTYEGTNTDGDNLYWVQLISTREFYETFDENDLRRNSIARFILVHDSNGLLQPEYFGENPDEEGVDYYYFAYKFRHGLTEEERGAGWANWANPINFPIIRYSDVLLMYAEASLRAHGNASAEALECVNQVRRRGFGKTGAAIEQADPAIDLTEITYENLLAERSFELCFEGQRWYDLVRFGKLEEGVKKLSKYQSTTDGTSQAQNFQAKHVIYPIPQDAIDGSNGRIVQNELWR